MKDPEWTCPVGDNSAWRKRYAECRGLTYIGPEPEKHSPESRDQEEKALRQVLFGGRFPRTAFERDYLRYMGGIRDVPEKKLVTCQKCKTEYYSLGFPAPVQGTNYPEICQVCADREDAGFARARAKSALRSVYND